MTRTAVIACLISAAVAGSGVYTWQSDKNSNEISKIKLKYAETRLTELADANDQITEYQEQSAKAQIVADAAIRDVNTRYAALVKSTERVRNEIERDRYNLPNSTCSSVSEYASTLGVIYTECREALYTMGRNAQGHAIDSKKLIDSLSKSER